MPKPRLSVIIPVWNGERHLRSALESVIGERDPEIEIVVSDDGSTDRSPAIAADYARRGRVVALQGPCVRNWVANTNAAVARSSGQYVTFLHQDDIWLAGRAPAITAAIARCPDRCLWISPCRFLDASGRVVGTWRLPFRKDVVEVDPEPLCERLLVQNFLGMPAPVFPLAAYERVGGMSEDLWFTADWDLWLRLGSLNGAGLDHAATTGFRVHNASQTITRAGEFDSMLTELNSVRARHLHNAPASCRDAVDRAGRFSADLNTSLAAYAGTGVIRGQSLVRSGLSMGLAGSRRFLRASRLGERVIARLRAGVLRGPAAS